MVQRSAMRKEKRSRTIGRDDVVGRLLGGGDDDDARRPPPRDQVAQGLGELGALVLGSAAHVEGQLVDGDDVEPELAVGLDLAQARRQQDRVATIHLGAEILQDVDGTGHVGPDEVLGRSGPRGQLDLLAVEQGQGHAGVERGGGDEERQGDRLAGSGLAAEQAGCARAARSRPGSRPRRPRARSVPTATPWARATTAPATTRGHAAGSRRGRARRWRGHGPPGRLGPRWWRPGARLPASIISAVRPGGRRRRTRCPAGISSVPSIRGIRPRGLMSWQAINTRLNQRRVARSRKRRGQASPECRGAPDDDADDPEEQDPGARPVEGGPDPPEDEDAREPRRPRAPTPGRRVPSGSRG